MNIYYSKFIDFFKRHNLYDKEMFDYLDSNSIMFDYLDEDMKDFIGIGCFWTKNNGFINKIFLGVPFINNDLTLLINIHEYIHGIMLYKKLGKRYEPGIDKEILPMMYEKLYVLENPSDELISYLDRLDKMINDDSDIEYKLGLMWRDKLIEMYYRGVSFDKLDKNVKKLSRKVKRKYK